MADQFWGNWLRGLVFLVATVLILAVVATVIHGAEHLQVPAGLLAFLSGLFWPAIARQLP